jgi:hypothetical protein
MTGYVLYADIPRYSYIYHNYNSSRVDEMDKFRADGKRDRATTELFLTQAEKALANGERAIMEFVIDER